MIDLSRSDQLYSRLSRDEQIEAVRRDVRRACAGLNHELGEWRHGGVLGDDAAVCRRCSSRAFILYGSSSLHPMVGAHVYGTALGFPCQPTAS